MAQLNVTPLPAPSADRPPFPVEIGEPILVKSNAWEGVRPGVVVGLGLDDERKMAIYVNVELNGLADTARLQEIRSRAQGSTVVLSAFDANTPMPGGRPTWFVGYPHPHWIGRQVGDVVANVERIEQLHGEMMQAVDGFSESTKQTGASLGNRIDEAFRDIQALKNEVAAVRSDVARLLASTTPGSSDHVCDARCVATGLADLSVLKT